jgi:hypothetical protein
VWDEAAQTLTIGAASDPSVVPARRDWTIRFLGASTIEVVEVRGGGEAAVDDNGAVVIAGLPADGEIRMQVRVNPVPEDQRRTRLFDILARAQWEHQAKSAAWKVLTTADDLRKVSGLQSLGVPESLLSALTEIVVSD